MRKQQRKMKLNRGARCAADKNATIIMADS